MSETEPRAPASVDASALLGKLLSNPELVRNLSSVLGASSASGGELKPSAPANGGGENAMQEGISRVLSNPEMMAKLPDVMKMLAPMVGQAQQAAPVALPSPSEAQPHGREHDRKNCRNDLLLALKPFLSPERCRAIDMLLGLSRLGDALQKMI